MLISSVLISMIEKEIQLYFNFTTLLQLIFLFIHDFLMVYNQSAFRILSLIALETIKNQREEKQESMTHCNIFRTFGILDINFRFN